MNIGLNQQKYNLMIKIQLTILIATLFLSCTSKQDRTFDFNPNGKTYVRLSVSNCHEPHSYLLINSQTLPVNQTLKNFNINNDTILDFEFEAHYPSTVSISGKNEGVQFFVIPNDTLKITLDFSKGKSLKEVINYDGETAKISEYLTKYRRHFYGAPDRNQTPESFNQELDSFYSPVFKVLDSLSLVKALPKWYVEIEKEDISCERDYNKFAQYRQRPWLYNDYTPKGESLKNQIDLSRLKYYWLFSSHILLGSFGPDKYDSLTQKYATKEIIMQRLQDDIDEINGKISAEALSYFIANRISMLFSKKKLLDLSPNEFTSYTQKIDEFIDKNAPLVTDTTIYNFIIREKNNQFKAYIDINVLTVGDKAPDFYLEDINGQMIKLSDFRGKLVLLNFWGTYCVPCIKSIPEKNDMVNELNQEQFDLVNICTDYNLSNWKAIVKENKFKGVHLICKGNWYEILRFKYQISGVPHYTIIDKEGLILKNNLKDSMSYFIEKKLGATWKDNL